MGDAKRDSNMVVTLIGVSSADGITPVTIYVDPTTHRVLVSAATASPGGSDTQVQFNDGGTLAGDSGLTFNKTTNVLTMGGAVVGTLNGVIIGTTGTLSAVSSVDSYVSNADLTTPGKVELATTAEINTGTDSTRAMPVDQFVASNRNVRYFLIRVLDPSSSHFATTTIGGDFEVPFTGTITEIGAWADTAGVTGTGTIDVNKNGTTLMTANKITLDSSEKTSRTAATPPALTTTAVTAGDIITVDIDAIQTTPAKGLVIRIGIRMT